MITRTLSEKPDVLAPDGSEVRILASGERGSMAHFRLLSGQTSRAVVHRTVEELWFIIAGEGEIWRRKDGQEEVTQLRAGISLTIPVATHFQFRNTGSEPLDIIGATLPSWPGDDEAVFVEGKW